MGVKEYRATGGNAALLKDYHRKSDSLAQWQIDFLPYEKQTYAFDYLGSGNHGIFSKIETRMVEIGTGYLSQRRN